MYLMKFNRLSIGILIGIYNVSPGPSSQRRDLRKLWDRDPGTPNCNGLCYVV